VHLKGVELNKKTFLPVIQTRNSSLNLREQAKSEFGSVISKGGRKEITPKYFNPYGRRKTDGYRLRKSQNNLFIDQGLGSGEKPSKFVTKNNKMNNYGKTQSHNISTQDKGISNNVSILENEVEKSSGIKSKINQKNNNLAVPNSVLPQDNSPLNKSQLKFVGIAPKMLSMTGRKLKSPISSSLAKIKKRRSSQGEDEEKMEEIKKDTENIT
jgi:hypothetical protein